MGAGRGGVGWAGARGLKKKQTKTRLLDHAEGTRHWMSCSKEEKKNLSHKLYRFNREEFFFVSSLEENFDNYYVRGN